jgi:3-deoxy-D-manno-octulosonic-acid transferase
MAPRHPERFEAVAALVAASGLRWQRRSQWNGQEPLAGGVFLLDSIGELASLYQFADLAFVGGSLVPRGGHNVLEAAQFGVAIVVGPYTENFRDIVSIFQRADALYVVTPQSLTEGLLGLLQDDAERSRLGQNALRVMRSQQGATERTVAALLQLLPAASVGLAPEQVGKEVRNGGSARTEVRAEQEK